MANTFETVDCSEYGFSDGGVFAELSHEAYGIYDRQKKKV